MVFCLFNINNSHSFYLWNSYFAGKEVVAGRELGTIAERFVVISHHWELSCWRGWKRKREVHCHILVQATAHSSRGVYFIYYKLVFLEPYISVKSKDNPLSPLFHITAFSVFVILYIIIISLWPLLCIAIIKRKKTKQKATTQELFSTYISVLR